MIRNFRSTGMAALATLIALSPALVFSRASAATASTSDMQMVIVTAPSVSVATADVTSVGGQVVSTIALINGVVANVPLSATPALLGLSGVAVSPDVPVSVTDFDPNSSSSRAPAAVFPQATGASYLAAHGITGRGVTVAVLDTGIDPLADFSGRLVDGVDLSGEGNAYHDSYGHGTFVAGLIAGNGASSQGQYVGEAPGANLVSVKVAGATGSTDLATVINGVAWVVAHENVDRIGVLNMSLGAVPVSSTVLNPLDMAVEAAWRNGVTVVTSAGNAGPFNGTILSPGDDPLVITAGALDDNGSVYSSDDTMTPFSSVGPTSPDGWFKPDLVASGRSVVSLRAPGSTIDQNFPSARIGFRNFVGSGTSFSAAITSGAAALVLQSDDGWEPPNVVKAQLLGSATPGPVGNPFVDGHGALNAYWAVRATRVSLRQIAPTVATLPGATVSLATTWSGSSWDGTSWNGSAWNGTSWNGSAWNGTSWNGTSWNGTAWNGTAWNGSAWNGSAWAGNYWSGTAWNGTSWNGTSWNGSAWNGSSWNGSAWNGTSWNGDQWL